ncbi:MAG: hypothetical protein ACREQ5_03290 [Candidatus Dormibacteria bacterium]
MYHLFSRRVYRAIGHEHLRNRREHAPEHIRARLAILDFVLAHLDYDYLETEPAKLHYFCGQLSIPKQLLPAKRYTGAIRKNLTERYFVDRFPMFFRPDSCTPPAAVNFTFIDPGWETLASFESHILAYGSLFGVLPNVCMRYVATRPTHFETARKTFLALVDRAPKIDPGEEILRYFRLRKAWELKKYALFSNDDIEHLNEFTQRFGKHPCQERYPAWRDAQVSDGMVRNQFRDLAPQRKASFETELVDGQATLFETNPKRRTRSETEKRVKTHSNDTFSSPIGPVFGEGQEEVSEK